MNCGLTDFGCHVSSYFAPLFAWWGAYDVLVAFIAGLIVGAILGRIGVTILLALAGMFLVWKKIDDSPTETDLPAKDREPPPKKRRTIF